MAWLHHPDGTTLHYRAQGEGVPVIALHGSVSTGAQWRSLVGYLEGRFEVFTPDLPGYGASPPLGSGDAGLAGDAAAIEALVDRIGGPVHLVGHSLGGAVALKLAALRPAAVRSLTLIEPVAFHLLRDGTAADRALFGEIAALGADIGRHVEAGEAEAALQRFIDYWNGAGAWARTSPRLQAFFLACLDRLLADFRGVAGEAGGVAELARIGCPALVVMGLESPATSMRTTEIVAEALPRAVLKLIPEAGHMVPLTDPHLIDPMIAGHLMAADRGELRVPARAA